MTTTTTNPLASTLVATGRMTADLGRVLAKDIDAGRFARLAQHAGLPVNTNHPCFVFGHLALYSANICNMVGDAAAAKDAGAPSGWNELFGRGTTCRDDADGSIYPPMHEIMARFTSGYERACAAVEQGGDEPLLIELPPDDGFRKRLGFKKIGDSVNFMLTVHPQLHLGQVSAWRRMQGLGSALGF